MFRNLAHFLQRNARKVLIASSLLSFNYLSKTIKTQEIQDPDNNEKIQKVKQFVKEQSKLKVIKNVNVCQSQNIKEGQIYYFQIDDEESKSSTKKFPVIIIRYKGKLYGLSGACSYDEPLSPEDPLSCTFKDSIIFNNKLYCPYHGCAFDITSGVVEYGPAYHNLARFFVEENNGKVKLHYPQKIPRKVLPKTQPRDFNDLRKVLILGGDHHATMGCIYGLRQYEYGGQINLLMNHEDDIEFPYQQDKLHKSLINLKNKNLPEEEIQKKLNQNIYEKLKFQTDKWFEDHGVELIFNSESYRIIHKRYFPYLLLSDRSKVQFDGLVIAHNHKDVFPSIQNLTSYNSTPIKPPNVFSPFRNKRQHQKMLRYLNKENVKNILVVGLNPQSLQFCHAVYDKFPDIQIKMIDMQKENKVSEIYGPDIASQIFSQYKRKGMEFYVKINKIPLVSNYLNIDRESFKKNAISVHLDQQTKVKADCAVIFPNEFKGDNKYIHKGKFTDIDYTKKGDRVMSDPHCRTDTKRIFSIGAGSSIDFFFTGLRLQCFNPNVAFEQGLTAAFNILALNIPFHYIPFETQQYGNKRVLYCGSRMPFQTMFILGSVQKWDFVALYSVDEMVIGVTASPSRQKQFQVIRQSFRLNTTPNMDELVEGKKSIPQIYKDIIKSNKSACYKDEIHNLDDENNVTDVIWIERGQGSFAVREGNNENDQQVQVDSRGYVTEL